MVFGPSGDELPRSAKRGDELFFTRSATAAWAPGSALCFLLSVITNNPRNEELLLHERLQKDLVSLRQGYGC